MNSNQSNDPSSKASISYRDAGVDIEAGDQLVEQIKPFAKRTMRPEVMGGIGGFGSLFEVPKNSKILCWCRVRMVWAPSSSLHFS